MSIQFYAKIGAYILGPLFLDIKTYLKLNVKMSELNILQSDFFFFHF